MNPSPLDWRTVLLSVPDAPSPGPAARQQVPLLTRGWMSSISVKPHPGIEPGPAQPAEDDPLRALLAQVAARDAAAGAALRRLYDLTAARVLAVARRYTRDPQAAEEVAEDVFIQVWDDASRFDTTRGSAMAWLMVITRSRALDWCRRQKTQPLTYLDPHDDVWGDALASLEHDAQASPGLGDPAEVLQAQQHARALKTALQTLTNPARQLVALAFERGLTHSEIAQHLNMPLGTVKTTLRRASQHLQAALSP